MSGSRRTLPLVLAVASLVAGLATGCGPRGGSDRDGAGVPPVPSTTTTAGVAEPDAVDPAPASPPPSRPPWLGTRVLPVGPDGVAAAQPTPPELQDRRLPAAAVLPPPPDDGFHARVMPVPDDVLQRSTWQPACPVKRDELRYVTVSFWGFLGEHHTGELLLHGDVADAVVAAFRRLHELRFPIEEMRITTAEELDAPPTGDGNNTGAFVCRPTRGSQSWSEHAYGKAVDINPFHNPYVKGDRVLPELATAYVDRSWVRPGMLLAGSPEVQAFVDIGWGWGGSWRSVKDYMHFSAAGR